MSKRWKNTIILGSLAVSIAFILWLTLFSRIGKDSRNFYPPLWSYRAILNGSVEVLIENIGNIVLFIPVGIALSLLFRFGVKQSLVAGYKTYEFFKEFYKRDVILLNGDESEYETFERFAKNHPIFIVKPIDAHMGEGVHKESVIDNDVRGAFMRVCQSCRDNNEFAKYSGAVLEEIFDQDERMSAFHSGGVSDVRCTTLRVGDKVHVFYPWLSTGRDGRFLTPYADGRIVAGINSKTGIVETDGHTESGLVYTNHPNSGLQYKGFQIPEYEALIETVTAAAMKLSDITYIGFDMVLTKKGWAIQEANFAGEPVWQMLYGYGTKKEFENIIGWHLSKEFWWQEEVRTFK